MEVYVVPKRAAADASGWWLEKDPCTGYSTKMIEFDRHNALSDRWEQIEPNSMRSLRNGY